MKKTANARLSDEILQVFEWVLHVVVVQDQQQQMQVQAARSETPVARVANCTRAFKKTTDRCHDSSGRKLARRLGAC